MLRGKPSTIPPRPRAARARDERGQSLAEFALMLPVIVVAMLLAVDLGRVYFAAINLTNIARIGANYAAQNAEAWSGTGNNTIKARYQELMRKDAAGLDCDLPSTLPAPTFEEAAPRTYDLGAQLHVTLSCRFQMVSPFLFGLVGDSNGGVTVTSTAAFKIRSGSVSGVIVGGNAPVPTATATATVPPTPTATPTNAPTATATTPPDGTPLPTATATATIEPPVVTFYGEPLSEDGSGGGPPGAVDEELISGISPLTVEFFNTTHGGHCRWTFGDGETSNSCGHVVHTYTARGTFSVTLEVDGGVLTRPNYILVGCKVPSFAGVRKNSATTYWVNAGFAAGNLTALDGNGNYKINYQSLAGGLVNPPGGCTAATIQVGP
jgi:hypothetical protein